MTRKKKWDPERMKAAVKAMKNKEVGSQKAYRIFIPPQTTKEHYVKDLQNSSSEAITIRLGRKQVLSCEAENDLAENCLLMERKVFGLTMAGAMHLAYQLAARNGIKNNFCKRTEKTRMKWLKNFLFRHQDISVTISA